MSAYQAFLATKQARATFAGLTPHLPPGVLYPFQQRLTAWAIQQGRAALWADCVAGDTILQGPDGNARIDALAAKGKPIRVWALTPEGRVVAALATAPFHKGVSALYGFTLDDGRTITVTQGHRFLTPHGWDFAGALRVGNGIAVSGQVPLRSTGGRALSVSPPDGRYLTQTGADLPGHYVNVSRRHDQQLLWEASSARPSSPSPADVHVLDALCRHRDAWARRQGHTHRHQDSAHPSRQGYARQGNYAWDGVEYRAAPSHHGRPALNTQVLGQYGQYAIPGLSILECDGYADQVWMDDESSDLCAQETSICLRTIVGIHYITTADYFDLHVPDFETYLANGIWNHNTGLGKSRMQLVYANHVAEQAGDCLIFAPLSVGRQTATEAQRLGIPVTLARTAAEQRLGITITNYERLHLMDLSRVKGVVLDESSILKALDGKTRQALTDACAHIPYRLCCTATPAPNDHMELANHAEFLGVMTRQEMLSTYFVHDGGDTSQWRLKGHAVDAFWRWMASWAVALTHPIALGDNTPGYDLPPLEVVDHPLETTGYVEGLSLFPMEAHTLSEQRTARRAGLMQRVQALTRLVQASPDPWVLWVDLNDEGDTLEVALPNSIQIAGRHTLDEKEARLTAFQTGHIQIMISKPSICGFGLNWQHCAHIGFVGMSHSFETYYQAVRRCWRFGQTRPVTVHRYYLDIEAPIVRNLARKEAEARQMHQAMQAHLLQFFDTAPRATYAPTHAMRLPAWLTSEDHPHV